MQSDTVHTHQGGLLRHSILLLIAMQVGNVSSLLFQALMMRRLTVAEYGILASMLSLVLIMGTPLEALRTAVAHQTALMSRLNQLDSIKPMLKHWARMLGVAAGIIMVIGLGLSYPMAAFFHLPSVWPVVLTVFIIAGSLFIPYFTGALQGMQAFPWMAAHGQVWGIARYVAALVLVYTLSRTALTGLAAQILGVLASIAFGVWAVHRVWRGRIAAAAVKLSGGRYFLMSLFVLAGYAVLMNADIALVKRYFDPDAAGIFARAATIGRSIIFLPLPIAAAMFPKVVSSGLSTLADRGILLRAFLYTTALIVLSATVCTLAVDPIWRFFTGAHPDTDTRWLVQWILWAMAPLGLTFLLMNFELAQHRFKAPSVLVLLAVFYVGGVAVWHDSYAQVLIVLTIVSVSSLVIMVVDIWRAPKPVY